MNTTTFPVTVPLTTSQPASLRVLVDLEHTIFRPNGDPHTLQISQLKALPDAYEGVTRLSQLGHLSYCSHDEANNRFTRHYQSTLIPQWLCDHGFPHHEEVFFSITYGHRLEVLYEAYTSQGIPVLLIDDQMEAFLLEVARRSLRQPRMLKSFREHLHLVAFGRDRAPSLNFGIASFALPCWTEIGQLLPQLSASISKNKGFPTAIE